MLPIYTADRTLIAFGGAAPLHAARMARKLGMKKVVVPVGAGVGSAFGFLRASIAYEVVRTRHIRLDQFDAKTVNALFKGMRQEAEDVVRLAAPSETLVEKAVRTRARACSSTTESRRFHITCRRMSPTEEEGVISRPRERSGQAH